MKQNKLHKIKRLLGLMLCVGSIGLTVIAAPADLDPTFGSGGKVVSSPDGSQSTAGYSMALQPDGKIVMVGSRVLPAPSYSAEFVVARYNSDGSLDTTFGSGGWSSATFGAEYETAVSIDVQPDGKIVVGGTIRNFVNNVFMFEFSIVRFNPNGSLDTSFDVDGKLTVSFDDILNPAYMEHLSVLKVAGDGKIVVAGQALRSTIDDKFVLARINQNGSLDSTFGTNGKFADQAGVSNNDRINDLVVLPDGKIVVAGKLLTVVGNYRIAIKYNASGAREWTYQQGVNSVVDFEALNGIAVLPNGKFIVVGKRGNKIAAIRLNANGTEDTAFTNTTTMPNGEAYSVAIQPDGKIVANVFVSGSSSFSLIRFNADGSPDSGFGNGGIVNTTVTSGQDAGRKLLIQPDGKFLVGGYSQLSSPTRHYFTLVRYKGVAAVPNNPLFDYDGDGKSDVSVYRPSEGVWYLNRSTSGYSAARFGISTDRIVPADYDGDGRTDIAVYRDGFWYWLNSSNGNFNTAQFGTAGDVPVPADYTGDGRAELAVYRAGFWYTLNLATNAFQAVQFGASADKPVPADFDADGRTDFAVYRDGVWYSLRSTAGFAAVLFGISSDKPTVGDYDGDGRADQAVYRSGVWYILGSMQGFYGFQFGAASDVPVAADYDGDGKTDAAVFRDGIWYMQRSQQGFGVVQFGAATDRPIPAAFVP